jgi:hypothetical protein
MPGSRNFHVDVWTDIGCPLCHVQLPVIDALRDEYRGELSFRWRAFEANPVGIARLVCPAPSYIEIFEAAVPLAEARGVTLRLPPVLSRTGRRYRTHRRAGRDRSYMRSRGGRTEERSRQWAIQERYRCRPCACAGARGDRLAVCGDIEKRPRNARHSTRR